ncbi:MAG: rhodanese-like domain-containing protein [Nitrospirota bacterium]|nr:rhodanese-like domain-containing protein [Nitrospirota bacterium]
MVSEPAALKELMDKDIAHVLVDLRDAKEAEKGFIPGAVSISAKDLAAAKDKFPADKSAPIILYADKFEEEAFKTVRTWGYGNTSLLNGGITAWTKDGGKAEKGKLAPVISYVPKPRPGEIAIEEFRSIAEKGSPDKIILDVRESDETANGMIKGATNIPESTIKDRLKELPKDKEFIVHCATGIRAENVFEELKGAGFKARFLNAVIQIDKDGKYEITKK